jgi:hypothetical protein
VPSTIDDPASIDEIRGIMLANDLITPTDPAKI